MVIPLVWRGNTGGRWRRPIVSICLLVVLCVVTAFAQDSKQKVPPADSGDEYPDLVELDPFGGVSTWGQINRGLGEKLMDGGTTGARLTVNVGKYLGLEVSYNFNVNNVRLITPIAPGLPTYNFGDQIHYWALNPVFNLRPRGSRVQPYLTVGVGPIDFVPTKQARDFATLASTEATYDSQNLRSNLQVGLNFGGGIKLHLTDHLGLRFDVRGLLSRNPTFGLPNFNDGGIYIADRQLLHGVDATAGLVFYFGKKAPPPAPPAPPPPPPPLSAGDITGGDGQLCQNKAITVHSTATDPLGHTLNYSWKLNGAAQGGNSPDFSFTPNNAGSFTVEVAVSDSTVASRTVTIGPKTLSVLDYTPPQIASVTATPTGLSCAADTNGTHTSALAAQATPSACGGNLSYKWTVTEGSVTSDTSANATFDASSLSFDPVGGSKTVTATLTATDEAGKSASQTATITVNCPPQFKRLPDVVFAKNNSRVNNCGKRILMEQAAPQAGTAYDIVLVAHRSADEREKVVIPRHGRVKAAARSLDEQRALNAAAVLSGGHGTCANLDPSQIKLDLEGTDQTSTPDPGLCGTSNLAETKERKNSQVSDADKERRVEVYLVPKGSQVLPPAAKNTKPAAEGDIKALGCPK